MKTYKNLLHKKDLKELCKNAILKASKHKTKRKSVQKVLSNLDFYVNDLVSKIESGNLELKEPHKFIKNEYGKEREIVASPFYPNQCLDYVLLESGLKEIIISKLQYQSFGNVPKKGCHKALKYITKHNQKYNYFLKFDIEHYYQNIDKNILLENLKKVVVDNKFIKVLKTCLFFFKDKGLPIGSILSQYLALFYLKDFAYF